MIKVKVEKQVKYMLTSKLADQTTNADITSIFEDRRKNEGISHINSSTAFLNRRKSNFNNSKTWYLRASIK